MGVITIGPSDRGVIVFVIGNNSNNGNQSLRLLGMLCLVRQIRGSTAKLILHSTFHFPQTSFQRLLLPPLDLPVLRPAILLSKWSSKAYSISSSSSSNSCPNNNIRTLLSHRPWWA